MGYRSEWKERYYNDPRWKKVTELCNKGKFAEANELQIKIWKDYGRPS